MSRFKASSSGGQSILLHHGRLSVSEGHAEAVVLDLRAEVHSLSTDRRHHRSQLGLLFSVSLLLLWYLELVIYLDAHEVSTQVLHHVHIGVDEAGLDVGQLQIVIQHKLCLGSIQNAVFLVPVGLSLMGPTVLMVQTTNHSVRLGPSIAR